MRRRRVAVLGAGVMGTSTALFLARRGCDVTLVDREGAAMRATSRWNEGKIHLGYLYGADSSLNTARHVIPGGLMFGSLLEELIGRDLDSHTTSQDDIYLVHRDSVVGTQVVRAQFRAVSELVRQHPDASRYLTDVSAARATELSPAELRAIAGDDIVAGLRVPERSVNTRWVADQLVAAIDAEDRVTLQTGTEVLGVDGLPDGRWRLRADGGFADEFDVVVNALWNGRLPIDVTAGVTPEPPWSHRYRLCVFARTREVVDVDSAIVAVGPFGDVKNYNGRDFYLSWYPVGLMAEGSDLELSAPETPTGVELERFLDGVRSGLGAVMPGIGRVFDHAEEVTVNGGFVFARGAGSIGDPASGLHRRDRYGVQRFGSYFSVDTGKYSTAPWLAERLAKEIAE